MAVLAIDFDGVIHDPSNVLPGQVMGQPMPGALEGMVALHQAGHQLIIHTVRGDSVRGRVAVEKWLRWFDVPFFWVTATKPNADVYLDDKAVRFESWAQALEVLL